MEVDVAAIILTTSRKTMLAIAARTIHFDAMPIPSTTPSPTNDMKRGARRAALGGHEVEEVRKQDEKDGKDVDHPDP